MKKLLLIALLGFSILAVNANKRLYFVQLGTDGAASWDNGIITANNGTLVNLKNLGQSLPVWHNEVFSAAHPAEDTVYIHIAAGVYTFTERIKHQSRTYFFGGYNGTSLTRETGENRWDFISPTVFDGNNNTIQFIYAGGSRSNVIFDGITLRNGGGGVAVTLRGSEKMMNCILKNNINAASEKGGALLFYGGGNSYNCLFEDNSCIGVGSNGLGGDIAVIGAGNQTVDGCVFRNSSADSKGAVFYVSGGSTTLFSNNLVTGAKKKAAFYIDNSIVNFINNTFINNEVVSVYVNGTPNVKIYNSVFWASLPNCLGKVAGAANTSTVIKNCALMEDHPATWTSSDNFLLAGTNTGDLPEAKYPAFVNPENNDFRITQTSALYNAGAVFADLPNVRDFFGTARPQGSNPEIGYHEFTEFSRVSTPFSLKLNHYVTNGQLTICNKEAETLTIRLFDSTGRMIKNLSLEPEAQEQLSLPSGIYFINTSNNNQNYTIKSIIP